MNKYYSEDYYEELLNVKTTGEQQGYNESFHYNRYEATNYYALQELFNSYKISADDSIIDFGCGKGRLNFFASYLCGCRITGIEMNDCYFNNCLANKASFLSKHNKNADNINFLNCLAEEYEIDDKDNIFYFFNPFSVQIFMKVIDNIMSSVQKAHREVSIILYYPSNEYIFFLEKYTKFSLSDEIKMDGFSENDKREKFLVYKLNLN